MDIQQGEDMVIAIPVTDGTAPVDLTLATEIHAVLAVNDLPAKRYELDNDESGDLGKCAVDGGNTGTLNVLVRSEHSKAFPLGILKANIAYVIPDDILGTKRVEFNFTVGAVKAGYTKDI